MDSAQVTFEQITAWLTERIAQVLKCPTAEVDAETPFAALGLDSLSLLTLTGDLAEWMGRDLSASLFLDHPMIHSLAQHLMAGADSWESQPIPRAPRGQPLPLTLAQARILSHSHLGPEGDGNIIRRRSALKGKLNVDALQRAFGELIRRHEILRTTFLLQNGEGMQVIHPPGPFAIEFRDLSVHPDAEARAKEIATHEVSQWSMDLQKGPLFRVLLLKLREDEHRLCMLVHHMNCDAEALAILCEELGEIYGALVHGESSPLPDLPLQAADVGAWQQQWLRKDGAAYQNQLAWWMQHWEGHIPAPLELPFRRQTPPIVPPHAADCDSKVEISSMLIEQVRELAHSEGATSYMVFLAAFAVVLHRLTGEEDLVIGTYVSDRTRSNTRRLMGVFINMLPIRLRLQGVETFREALALTRDVVEQATRHRELPLEDLRSSLSAAGKATPEVRVIFQMVPKQQHVPELEGLEVTRWQTGALAMPWGFNINLMTRDTFAAHAYFDGNLYESAGARALLRDYKELLLNIVTDADTMIRSEVSAPVAV